MRPGPSRRSRIFWGFLLPLFELSDMMPITTKHRLRPGVRLRSAVVVHRLATCVRLLWTKYHPGSMRILKAAGACFVRQGGALPMARAGPHGAQEVACGRAPHPRPDRRVLAEAARCLARSGNPYRPCARRYSTASRTMSGASGDLWISPGGIAVLGRGAAPIARPCGFAATGLRYCEPAPARLLPL
jgi:hypothetical protein